jgi:hypothetical protein
MVCSSLQVGNVRLLAWGEVLADAQRSAMSRNDNSGGKNDKA